MRLVPKKKQIEPPDEQSRRFVEDAQRMIDAGELSPTEADEALDQLVRKQKGSSPK
ncbi:MAG: hypothetical protein H0X36_06985 [Sphingomonadaceae bacterium]|nr:hypothetical protein [Sphingomonadaceae bacterium]